MCVVECSVGWWVVVWVNVGVGGILFITTIYILTTLASYNKDGGNNLPSFNSSRFTITAVNASDTTLRAACPTAVGNVRSMRMHPGISNFVAGIFMRRNRAISTNRTLFSVSDRACRTTIHSTTTTIGATGTRTGATGLACRGGGGLCSDGVVNRCRLSATTGNCTATGTRMTRTRTTLTSTHRRLT